MLRALATAADDVVVSDAGGVAPIGRLSRAAVARHGRELPLHVRHLALDTLDPYAPELRGDAPPYALRVRSAAERARAWRVLLDHVQKRALDLPGRYFDTPFENALVRLLAPLRVVVANIVAGVLIELLPHVGTALHRDGDVIVSGILVAERDAFLAQTRTMSWTLVREAREGDWWAGHLRRALLAPCHRLASLSRNGWAQAAPWSSAKTQRATCACCGSEPVRR